MSKKKSHYGKAGLVFEELEPRLLLSADPLAVAADASAAIVQEHQMDTHEDRAPMINAGIEQTQAASRNELVFIDARAPNYQQLHNDLIKAQQQGRTIHIVVLDAHRDGIEQITAALANHHDLDAVHIISHGDGGQLQLGTTVLDKTVIQTRWADVSRWREGFTDSGDLLIYGCNLANTAEGKYLVNTLGYLTETDVAASDDLTGHRLLGGDWELEYQAGDIETAVAFSDHVHQTWQGTLQTPAPAGAEQQQSDNDQQQSATDQQQVDTQSSPADQQAAPTETAQAKAEQDHEDEQSAATDEQRQEIVFIDWTVSDFGTFVDYLKNDADDSTRFDVILLDSERNGVEQIEEVLSDYRDVDAVHIITHGGDGAIKLGDTWLNTNNIDQYSENLTAWASAFDQHTDILFYGCNVADSADGENFIDRLAQLTGADVAASDDLTGHDSKGGDWDLEYRAGSVETAVAIDETTQAAYRDTLSTFVVSNTNATGAGSLHQAILDANANTGVVDTIAFNITGPGPHIISLSGPLPVIDEAVIIDGTTEPDFSYAGDGSPRPVVVIDGSAAGAVDGLVIGATGGGSTIRGLVIQNFQNDGILLLGGNNTITANILGLQADGVTIAGNNLAAAGIHGNIRIESSNNIIGGLTAAERNIISGSGFSGIALFGASATGNQILGNFIGTDITGTLARGNAQEGIEIQDAGGNIIGGTVVGARNVISANGSDGMEIDNGDNNTIQGNFIGTDVTGTLALGNARDGIDINENSGAGSTGNLIGGIDPNAANLIAHNGMYGVEIRDVPTINNPILGNRIYANGLIGIQLSDDGVVTLNDAGDSDGDSNNLQNFPVLSTADTNNVDTIVIDGSLNSSANSYFRIEFFASSTADGSGHGEGENYLGHANVTTDGSGNASFSAALSATVAPGAVISATATRSDATFSTFTDTSEFAANINAITNLAASATDDPQAYSSYLVSLGPSGYWRLGESAGVTALDATGLNNGSYNGATPGQAGAIAADGDTALRFDGIDDYMTLAHDPAYLLDDGTVQFWFNTADVNQRGDLFSKDALGNGNGGHLSIYLDGSGNIETRLQSTSTSYFVRSTSPLTNNQWHHVAFTFGAGGMQLYVDGQLQDSDAYTGGLGTTSGGSGNVEPIAIGASTQVSGSGSVTPLQDYFSGDMDEVALFGSALTPEQIRNLYAGGVQNYSVTEDNTLNVSAVEGVLINDYDQEGDTLTAMLVSGPSNAASFTLYNDGSFDYTPVASFTGTDSFTYVAHDGTSTSNVATVTITVTANTAPVARDDRIGLVFDGIDDYVTIGDHAGLNVTDNLTMEAWVKPTGLGSGTKIIVNKEGEYEMAINATNGHLMWAFDNIDPDWNWHNTGYSVQPDEWTHLAVTYDNGVVNTYANGVLVDTYNGSGTIGDNYPVLNQLMIGGRENSTMQRFNGQIDEVRVWNTTRTQLEIQSNMNALLSGVESGLIGNWRFDEGSGVTVNDQSVFAHHGTLADGINAAEMPAWQGYVVSEGSTLNVAAVNGVLANDVDIDGDALSASLVSGPSNAAAFTLNPDGSFDYTPTAGFTGVDSFSYRANDGSLDSNIATVTIRVDPVNDVPVATANTVTTTEDTAYNFSAADFTYTDTEGDALVSAQITNLSLAGGTLTHSGGTTVTNGTTLSAAQLDTLVYTPAANANGAPLATFDFTVNDADAGVVAAQMSINVTAQPDPAIIGGVATGTVTEDDDPDLNNLIEVSGALTIIDPDAGEAAFNAGVFGGTYGVVTLAANGDWDYAANNSQPAIQGLATGATLTDTITISSVDGTTRDIVITIVGTNDAPVAGNDIASVNEGGSVIIALAASDSDIDNALDLNSIVITSLPVNGSVVVNGDGTVTYTHNGSETAGDSFSYTIADVSGAVSNTASVAVTVNPINDAPMAVNDSTTVLEGDSVLIDLAANDSDADSSLDLNSIVITAAPTNGSLVVNGDGTVTYTHDGSNTTNDSFSYTIADTAGAASNIATVNIGITPVNDAPTTSGIADVNVHEDDADTVIDLNAAFDDADNTDAEMTYAIVGNTNIGLFSSTGINAATGQLTLAYAADMNGSAQITIRASDPAGQSVDTLFTVSVSPVNDAPVLQTNAGKLLTGTEPTTISRAELRTTDIDNADTELVYTLTALPANGELLLNGVVMSVNDSFTQADLDNNLLVYRPVSLVAADGFGFTVSDGAGGSLSANTFNIFVQLTQSDDDVAVDESPLLEEQQNEEIDQETAAEDNTVSSITDSAVYGSSFEPFGQASTPPAPTPPAPTPVLSIDPAPPPKPPTQAGPVEAAPEIVTEIEDYQVSTFAAVQVKSMHAMWSAIDKMKQDMADVAEKQTSAVEIRVAAAETTGVVLTAGVVAWILRSGALLSSLISSIPLWKGYDPLPILAYSDDEQQKNKEEFDENKIPTSMDDLKKLKEVMKQKETSTNETDVDSMFGDSVIRE